MFLPLLLLPLIAIGSMAQHATNTNQTGANASPQSALHQATQQAKQLLAESKTGKQIRQCSCAEQDPCMARIRVDVDDCFQTCWQQHKFAEITTKPEVLKGCFESRGDLLDTFISCVNSTAKTCVADKNGPMIDDVSFTALMEKGEQKMLAQAKTFEKTMGPKNKPLVQTAVTLGTCMKDCYVKKEGAQACFAQAGCQPKLEEDLVGPVIKRCAWRIGWKKEAYELCDCFLQAGIESVKPYCQVLRSSQGAAKKKPKQQQQQKTESAGTNATATTS